MDSEIITKRQCMSIMAAFILGSAIVLGVGSEAKKDAWIAILAAMLISVPVFTVYGRILSLFPEKGLYEILIIVFGKTFGKIMILPFMWFSFHLGALVIRNFTEFIMIVTLTKTPQYIVGIFLILLCIWAVKAGIEVIGRWTVIVLPAMITAIFVITFLLIPLIELRNIKPIMYDGIKPILNAAFSVFSFPFAETVLFMVVFCNLKKKENPYKIFFWSLLIGGGIIAMVALRSILTLGEANVSIFFFSTYASVRLINIGEFLQRIEVLVGIIFISGGFVKISICLYAASKGLSKVLSFQNYRQIVAPVGLLMMILSIIVYDNTTDMFDWAKDIYKYYALPFQIILPLIIWITAEIKMRKKKGRAAA